MNQAHVVALTALLLAAPLAGCAAEEDAAETATASAPTSSSRRTAESHAVIAFVDTGINPYHEAFRTNASHFTRHPSTYLPTYPEDAVALNLTFDHARLREAVAADCGEWAQVEPHQLYYVPGTRIVGLMNPVPDEEFAEAYGFDWTCEDAGETWPPFIRLAEHGTMVASRGAGSQHGACPECLIVSVQGCCGFRTAGHALRWSTEQPWIDVLSNSWEPGHPVVCPADPHGRTCPGPSPEVLTAMGKAASRQPTFWASGNGLFGRYDIAGHPAQVDPKNVPHVIRVGGHDNGRVLLWPGSSPNLVSDACWSWGADHESLHDRTPRSASGTSAAAPYAAGLAAGLVREARTMLGDHRTGVRDQVLAEGASGSVAQGPLTDGELTMHELKRVLFTTAEPRPDAIADDGEPGCAFRGERRPTIWALPFVHWSDIPDGPVAIPVIGYGAATPATLEHGVQVLRGDVRLPERPLEDAYFEVDGTVREAAHAAYTNTSGNATDAGGS